MRRLLVTLKGAYNITWHRSDELTLWKSIFWLTHIYARNKWWENEIDLSVDSSFYLPCFGIIWSICWSMDMHHTFYHRSDETCCSLCIINSLKREKITRKFVQRYLESTAHGSSKQIKWNEWAHSRVGWIAIRQW